MTKLPLRFELYDSREERMNHLKKRIGVFTDNKNFNEHITALRKYGYDIRVVTSGDHLNDFSSVFIDFSCKGEVGYKLLDRIVSSSQHWNINIIAIISGISDLDNLTRQHDIRLSDYVTLDISHSDLISKLKVIVAPESKPRKTFEGAKVFVTTKGYITHISESGVVISAPVSFTKNTRVELISDLIEGAVKEDQPILKTSKSFPLTKGLFYSEIDFLNLSSRGREGLRKMIFNWAVK